MNPIEKLFGNFNYQVLGNALDEIILALGVFLVATITFKIIQKIIIVHLKKLVQKTKTDIDDTLIKIFQSLKPPFYFFLAIYLALQYLNLHPLAQTVINFILIIWIVYQIIIAIQILINYLVRKGLKDEENPGAKSAIETMSKVVKGILWVIGALFILSNLGINVTSLVAGLGIGGVAIALALQNILGDLFSSFSIFLDKPFVPGDFIIVGEHKGVVEKVGIKTTRLRSLSGEEIVISNKELTETRIQNFRRMEERRISFNLGVTYETPNEKLRKIPGIIKNIISSVDKTRFDRTHFKSFDDFALTFEIVYYIISRDYTDYMNAQQEINFKTKDEFEKEGIIFAYPTQTVYIEK